MGAEAASAAAMLILLSPAKTLDFETPYAEAPSEPRFAAEAARIARAAAKLGPQKLSELMHISDKLATLNHQRFKGFAKAEPRPAIRAFAGDVYRGFDAASADEDTIAFAQDHLRILSGLTAFFARSMRFGLIGSRWERAGPPRRDGWSSLGNQRSQRRSRANFPAEGSGLVVNLASNEYFAVLTYNLAQAGDWWWPPIPGEGQPTA